MFVFYHHVRTVGAGEWSWQILLGLLAVQSDWGRLAESSMSPGGAVVVCMVGG